MGNVGIDQRYLESLAALLSAIEVKDHYTARHSIRVAEIVAFIGRGMGLPEEALHALQYAALLHDLGKIGVSEVILNKRGHLTDEEWEALCAHPEEGVLIAQALTFLNHCLPVIVHHHERFDGSGYPEGLHRDQIPLDARILHLADALDAMCTHRPYRRALSRFEIRLELEHGLGADFDPDVVTTLFDLGLEDFLQTRVETRPAVAPEGPNGNRAKPVTVQELQALLGLPATPWVNRFIPRFMKSRPSLTAPATAAEVSGTEAAPETGAPGNLMSPAKAI